MPERRFCSQCGSGVDPTDAFCARCGEQLEPAGLWAGSSGVKTVEAPAAPPRTRPEPVTAPSSPRRRRPWHAAVVIAALGVVAAAVVTITLVQRSRDERAVVAAAETWLAERLAGTLPEGVTVVYHSIAWQYFPQEVMQRAREAIESAGARATPGRRLVWLRFEHDLVFAGEGQGFTVDLVAWPGGEHRRIATADPHARWVEPSS
jgi:hypothetical protein